MMTSRILSAIAITTCAVLLSNCRSARAWSRDARCTATTEQLSVGSSADGLAGEYRVTFVGTEAHARGKRLTATLRLYPQDSSRQPSGTFMQFYPNLSYPIYGALHGDLARVGGFVHGRTDSVDPDRPGVMMLRTNTVYQGRAYTRIALRIGDEGNQRDVVSFDGTAFIMDVAVLETHGFRGTWSSSVGISTLRGSGHYCASRLMAPNH